MKKKVVAVLGDQLSNRDSAKKERPLGPCEGKPPRERETSRGTWCQKNPRAPLSRTSIQRRCYSREMGKKLRENLAGSESGRDQLYSNFFPSLER